MKKITLLLLPILFIVTSLSAQQEITLEKLWQEYTYYARSVPGFNFQKDGKHYTRLDENTIQQYDFTTGKVTKAIFDPSTIADAKDFPESFQDYTFSEDESKILIKTASEAIYRRSSRANFFVWDNQKLLPLYEEGKQMYATFNPMADKVAFVHDNNLYFKDLGTAKVTQITKDGKYNHIINGATDWVYEEEFSFAKAFFWSPDGKKIAYYRFDESKVKEFTMTNFKNGLYPEYVTFKYPKVGEKNSTVAIYIYDLETGKSVRARIGKDTEYVPRIKWTQDANQLCVFKMNRHQNELELLLADATTGKTSSLLKEKNKYYIDVTDDLTFLKNGKQFIWTSEKSGYNHIYLYDMKGRQQKQLTKGDYDVSSFYGINEDKGIVYYQAAKNSPMQREIYAVNLKGKKTKQLTSEAGWNDAQFSSTFEYYVHNHATINTPPTYTVYNIDGRSIRSIEDNARIRNVQKEYNVQKAEFFNFKTSEDVSLNGYMIKPPNFDESKQYPVFMYVYGGPGSQTVRDTWGSQNYWWFQMLAQKGYIVVSVDNRGTGARGEEFKKMTYLQLGKYETIDQIEAGKYLASLPYTDAGRVGIFGWSYGGYMSSLALAKGNDVFKAAIAVAPVTSWRWYDTIYTERYMRTEAENEAGYADNSPVNFTDMMKGNYLLVHGNADDNVHFQNAAEMVNALIRSNKQFDTYYYPNRNHGIYGGNTRLHLYTKMTNFLMEKL